MGLLDRLKSTRANLKNSRINPELATELMNKTQKEIDKMDPINILVAGKTGSGKSTLINAVFREKLAETGVGKPVTQHLEKITKEGVPLTLYDTKGLELTPQTQHEVLKSLSGLIKTQKAKGQREAIDLAYYCINSNMARIEPFEIELIEAIGEHIPVVIVLTQTIGQEAKEFEDYLNELLLPVKAIIPVLAKPYLIQGQQFIPSFGLQDLIDTTLEIVPEQVHRAFINAQQIDLDRKVDNAKRWAKTYISTAFGVGFTPIPLSDSAILVPMQVGMLAHITSIFGLSLDKAQILSMIAGIGGTGGATLVGKYIASSLTKLIPGLGTIGGGAVSGATASVLTMALAFSYIEVLRVISKAEMSGKKLPLSDIQKVMNESFKDQLDNFSHLVPDSVRESLLPAWVNNFFK